MAQKEDTEYTIIKSKADLREYGKNDVKLSSSQKYSSSPIRSTSNNVYGDREPDKMSKLEQKLQNEIRLAQKVLDKNDDINEMFSDDDEYVRKNNRNSQKPTYNAAKEILKKYGPKEQLQVEEEKIAEKSEKKKKKKSDEDYGVPAADMIIKKYPKPDKKKKSLKVQDGNSLAEAKGSTRNETGTQYDPPSSRPTTVSGFKSTGRRSESNGNRPGTSQNANELEEDNAAFTDRPHSTENSRRPATRYANELSDGHPHQHSPPPDDPKPREIEYDGFDSDEEKKLKGNKSKVVKVSNDIFGGKYENRRISNVKSQENSVKNNKTLSMKSKNDSRIDSNNSEKSSSSAIAKDEDDSNAGSDFEKQSSTTPTQSAKQQLRPETRPSSSIPVSKSEKSNQQKEKIPFKLKADSTFQPPSSVPKKDIRAPSPVQNKHFKLLDKGKNDDDNEDGDVDEEYESEYSTDGDPEEVLTNYLQEKKQQKEARSKTNNTKNQN